MRFLAILLAPSLLLAQPFPESESWIDSPEAYFATAEERGQWAGLGRDDREDLKRTYWLRRDPTPETERNEFREVVLGRIRTADERWAVAATAGSRTSRGMLFILFGSPARVKQEHSPRLERPCVPSLGGPPCSTGGLHEGNEVSEVWIWDRERTPHLLEALGRPDLEVTVIVEPSRRTDRIQNPGLVHRYRDLLAAKSIVRADPVPIRTRARESIAVLEEAAVSPNPAPPGDTDPTTLGNALVWSRDGTPRAIFWRLEDERSTPGEFSVLLEADEHEEPASWRGSPSRTEQFLSSIPASVWTAMIEPRPGRWSGTFSAGGESQRVSLEVPSPDSLGVSSLLLSGGPQSVAASDPILELGGQHVPIRADATFSPEESVWYFLQIHSPEAPRVSIEPRLMRKGSGVIAAGSPFEPELSDVGSDLRAFGYEISLDGMEPGEYTLYLTLRANELDPVVRRADFRVLSR
ncbi:MAG TPA: GWxTD domain-containing protein [Thermoanaerobaculia bacterium]|nr:GWxTD domain-containing protein [Thermoanaerobaculia bacterium]